ncbi:MAG TPA: energy transducer TonB [Phaeodactylibacter sp.]|nr:energy transducer TonB [Phaeodactylibacter sp.]
MTDLAISSSTLATIFAVLFISVLAIIFLMRAYYQRKSNEDLASSFNQRPHKSPLEGRNKYPEVDAFSLSGTFFNIGLLMALGMIILAFSWTTYEKVVDVSQYMEDLEEEIEVEPPRTAEPPPPPPPPPPPVIEEVPEEEIEEEDEPVFEDMSIEVEEEVVAPPPVVEEKKAPPPPPPPPPEPEVEEIFTVVEDMPRFPGCEDKTDKAERTKCAQEKMLQFIYKHIKYPPIARENGIEGTTVIRFYVDKDGTVKEPQVLKDIGAGCGAEAMRVVNLMNKKGKRWIPGKQRGKPVKVYFNLPVRFRLE